MFELASPWVLCALPLPLLFWFLLPRAQTHIRAALHVPFFTAMLGLIQKEERTISKKNKFFILFLSWCLMLMALAGPRWVGAIRPLAREGYNIMLALDISGSMALNDMRIHGRPSTRLNVVKEAARQFVHDRVGDKLGLILFGSQAYVQTPLTYDRHSVLMRIDDATVGLAGKTTSIGDALGLAIKRLQSVPDKGRMIIILTDGVNNSGVLSPLKAAELAQKDKIKIYTIGLGAEIDPQALGQLFFDMNVTAELDEQTLKEVAKMTGGKYFRATDMHSLQAIYQHINAMERVQYEDTSIRPQHEYYPWFLVPALMLLLYCLAKQAGLLLFFSRYFERDVKEVKI